MHDELDAVSAAYGWPVDLTDEEILQKLVVLNAERAEEERRGIVRWLRPEFQNPGGTATTQESLGMRGIEPAKPGKVRAKKPAWPKDKDLVGQIAAVRATLAGSRAAMTATELAATLKGAKTDRIAELLEALEQARRLDGGRFAA